MFEGKLYKSLNSLPIIDDDLYLHMQVMNLSVVDAYLNDVESNLLKEYIKIEKTPVVSAVFASALSQLWIFGVYELLRTWRQRARELLKFKAEILKKTDVELDDFIASKSIEINKGNPFLESETSLRWFPYEKILKETESFSKEIENAIDRTEFIFRRIEALRIHLAKHEVPKKSGSEALAPGYGRIDMIDGSIYFQVLLGNDEVDIISRRKIANDIENSTLENNNVFIPRHLRASLRNQPQIHYGVKCAKITLFDGTVFQRTWIAWDCEVVRIEGLESIPFTSLEIKKIEPVLEE